MVYDVIIIGAGAIGCALARQLSQTVNRVLVLEAGEDVSIGATRANSGIVHGGFASKNGSNKARFCLAGNRMFSSLSKELDFPYRQTGSVVLAFRDEDWEVLENLRQNGLANGVEGLSLLKEDALRSRVPRLAPEGILGALYCPESGIVSPYEYAIALMENAVSNGVELKLFHPVQSLQPYQDQILVQTPQQEFAAHFVVNAAGCGAAEVAAMAGPSPFSITPRKGQYILFRRGSGDGLNTVVFQPPGPMGKGVLVTPTTWSNLMIGPDAQEIEDANDVSTDPQSLASVVQRAKRSVCDFQLHDAIRLFSGVRPASNRGDFILEWSEHLPGLLHLAGIESPGLTASPALAQEAFRMLVQSGLSENANPDFTRHRRAPVHYQALAPAKEAAAAARLPEGNPERIVCRCEQVEEQAIKEALHRGIPLSSTDAVKRRTRAGMGICQGNFCLPRVKDLLVQETQCPESDILLPSRDKGEMKAQLDALRRLLHED